MHKIKDLIVWKKAIQLTKEVYLLSSKIPNDEKFGIISQIKRCSVSIPSNIAEGAGRNSNNEFKHFLGIANGSCYELQTQLILIKELNLTNEIIEIDVLIEKCIEIQKMIYSFKSKIAQSNI